MAVYIDNLTLYGPPTHLMVTTVLPVKTNFKVTNMEQLHWLLGIQITFKPNSIELSQEACVDKNLEQYQMNDSHPTLLSIDPYTRLPKLDSILEAEKDHF
jgi:hypothetical protein